MAVIVIQHSPSPPLTHGFRLNLTVTYPTEYLYLNDSGGGSTVLVDADNGAYSHSSTIDTISGTVVFSTDVLPPNITLQTTITFKLTNNVYSRETYSVDHVLDWHNLPYHFTSEGRYYSTNGSQEVNIADAFFTSSYITSNEDTLGSDLQLQEHVFVNLTVTLPEVYIYTYINV